MEKFFELIAYINSVFYGEHWYIAWGIVAVLFGIAVAVELPKLIEAIKAAKSRSENNRK